MSCQCSATELDNQTTNHQPSKSSMYCTGGAECLSHTSGSHSQREAACCLAVVAHAVTRALAALVRSLGFHSQQVPAFSLSFVSSLSISNVRHKIPSRSSSAESQPSSLTVKDYYYTTKYLGVYTTVIGCVYYSHWVCANFEVYTAVL